MPHLIGLTGFKRSGKTTVADALEYGQERWVQLTFAGPIRAAAEELFCVSGFDLEAEKEQPQDWLDGVTPRQFMQRMGTEFGRQMIHPEIWIRSAMRKANAIQRYKTNVVVSDVRFDNEAQAILEAGGVVFAIDRPGFGPSDHVSEAGVSPHLIHARILNDGEDLGSFIENAVDQIRTALAALE